MSRHDSDGSRSVSDVFRTAAERLRRDVPYDAAAWLATDPATGLPITPTVLENRPCQLPWRLEFTADDVNRFGDLARGSFPAGALRLATEGEPRRSARYRGVLRPQGFDDELRAVLPAGGCVWGLVSLLRTRGAPPFSAEDCGRVAELAAPLGAELRQLMRLLLDPPQDGPDAGPGMLVFDAEGGLVSLNDDAATWLEDLGGALPEVVVATLNRACATGQARTRARGASGRWLVCHASCLREVDGHPGETALVIEPATAAELAPLIAEVYELSVREREIAELIAHGCGTAEIAERLHLSPHTVRDHIKASFEKLGVSTRGQLVAQLFGDPPR
jgi:DNA-binding CsgD family transcriptional regulator